MTTSTMERHLFSFASELLETSGGVVDWADPAQPGVAIVPSDLARAVALPGEEFALSLGVAATAAMQVSLAGDFLDVAARILNDRVPNSGLFRVGDRYLKRRDLEEAVQASFDWANARVRCAGEAVATRVEYHQWTLHARIQSDDLWESLVSVTFNSASGALLKLPDLAELSDLAPIRPVADTVDASSSAEEFADIESLTNDHVKNDHETNDRTATDHAANDEIVPPTDTEALAIQVGRRQMLDISQDFIQRIEQRLERDRKRVQDYYRALTREAAPKPRKGVEPPSAAEIQAKKNAVGLEQRRKLGELTERYSLRAELRPLVLLRVAIPVLALPIFVQRKQASRTHTLYWNPLLKKLEPLRCTACSSSTHVVHFTNDTVEPQCSACFNPSKKG